MMDTILSFNQLDTSELSSAYMDMVWFVYFGVENCLKYEPVQGFSASQAPI